MFMVEELKLSISTSWVHQERLCSTTAGPVNIIDIIISFSMLFNFTLTAVCYSKLKCCPTWLDCKSHTRRDWPSSESSFRRKPNVVNNCWKNRKRHALVRCDFMSRCNQCNACLSSISNRPRCHSSQHWEQLMVCCDEYVSNKTHPHWEKEDSCWFEVCCFVFWTIEIYLHNCKNGKCDDCVVVYNNILML